MPLKSQSEAEGSNEQTYRLLRFHGSRLAASREIRAASFLEAVQLAAQDQGDGVVELWLDDRRIAQFSARLRP
jgi:hypothetical protein